MESYQRLSAGIGIVAMLFGLLVMAVPAVGTAGPFGSLQSVLEELGSGGLLLFAGAVVVGYLAIGLREKQTSEDHSPERRRFDRAASNPPESVSVDGALGTGEEIETAITYGGPAYQAVRRQLRESVIAVHADGRETSEAAARSAVDRGDWSQDPVANAFLSGEQGPTPAYKQQLRLFVLPEQERRRRIERTIAAIERVQQG